jgi:hypothetical protein
LANLPLVSFDTGGKFATGIDDTSGTFSKFTTGVVDTGGAPWLANWKKFEMTLMRFSGAWGRWFMKKKKLEAKNLVTTVSSTPILFPVSCE